MKPRCYNRPPYAEGRWHQVGRRPDGRPVLRWRARWYEDRCAAWDMPAGAAHRAPFPVQQGWDCEGCRWLPRWAAR